MRSKNTPSCPRISSKRALTAVRLELKNVAVLNEADKEVLGAKRQAVLLSSETLREHAKHGMGIADYQKLPDIMAKGEVYQQGELKLVYLWEDGILYRAAVKTTSGGKDNYLVTFFKTNDKDADRQLRNKLKRIR